MDLSALAAAVFEKYGAWGLIGLYAAYKVFFPLWKKRNGSWVSYRDLESRLKALETQRHSDDVEFQKMKAVQAEINKTLFIKLDNLQDSMNQKFDEARVTIDRNFQVMMTTLQAFRKG